MNKKNTPTSGGNALSRFNRRHPIVAALLMIALASCVLVWLALLFLDVWTVHGKTSTVPDVKGMSYAAASQMLKECDLDVEISDSIYDRSLQPGTVMEVWPRAGAVVKAGRAVYLTVTAFQPKRVTVTMPVTGVSSRQAISYLESLGITAIRIVRIPSQYADLVEGATADGQPLTVGSTLPVTATVTLQVGTVPVEFIDPAAADSTSAFENPETEVTEDFSTIFD